MLSLAGKVQLVNSILFHVTCFWCNAFILPEEVIKSIERCCRNFIWTGNWRNKGMPTVSWKNMCYPRNEGGLGIKQLAEWNKAAMGKHLWTLMTSPNNLWTAWMKCKLKGKSIWDVKIPHDCSWAWRKILLLREVVKQHVGVRVGDGRESSLFFDNWLKGMSLVDKMGNTSNLNQWGGMLLVKDWRLNGNWNIPSSFKRVFPDIAAEIGLIQCCEGQDCFIWKPNEGKGYSIASCYDLLRRRKPKVAWGSLIWNSSIMPRHSFIWWLSIHGKLKTRVFLVRRGLQIQENCSFCNCTKESVSHLFFSCPFSKQIWGSMLQKMGICHDPRSWDSEWNWIQTKLKGRTRRKRMCAAILGYTIIKYG